MSTYPSERNTGVEPASSAWEVFTSPENTLITRGLRYQQNTYSQFAHTSCERLWKAYME